MNLDEFSYFNQQLAGMLRSGLPLEGSLRRLAAEMAAGSLRDELRQLELALQAGTPPVEAISARTGLPELYRRLFVLGVRGNSLPAVLTLAADHYRQRYLLWIRLRAILFYPAIVLVASLALSIFLALLFQTILKETEPDLGGFFMTDRNLHGPWQTAMLSIWIPALLIFGLVVTVGLAAGVPRWRQKWSWRLSPFREVGLANMASAIALMLERGCPLPDAVAGVARLEAGSPIAVELRQWETRLAAGCRTFPQLTEGAQVVPPLFTWLVAGDGENWSAGFRHAAEVYAGRAYYRIEMTLYAILPVAVLGLGLLILTQAGVFIRLLGLTLRGLTEPF